MPNIVKNENNCILGIDHYVQYGKGNIWK